MDGHQKIDLELGKLLVNPENYRFDPVSDQQEAMITMLQSQNNKILSLARDIALHGLNPTRRLLVKEADGKYVILEGNRRITVLKLMTNPDEIPGDYLFKSIFEGLHAKHKESLPTVVECVVYPENQQDIADSWVLLEHTGENQGVGTVPWNTVQKDRFESRHKQQKLSRAVQVLDFLEANGIVTAGVEATNLERLLGTRGVPQELGIDFANKKKFVLIEPEEVVLLKFKKVVEHMKAKDFGVGEIYKVGQRLEWIRNVLAPKPSAPSPSEDTNTSAPAFPNGNTNTSVSKPPFSPSPSNATKTQPSPAAAGTSTFITPQPLPLPFPVNPYSYQTLINPAKLLPATIPAKIVSIYKELQTVYISGQKAAPHAVGALLRILVEITAQEYLVKIQKFYYDSSSNHLRNPKDPSKAYSELREKLNYVANQSGLPGDIAQVLRALLGKQLMTAELNQVVHSTIFTADAAAIKGIWQNFEKVFDHLINELK